MNKWIVRVSVVALVAIIALGAVSIVGAQGPDNRPGLRLRIGHALLQSVADATGLSVREVWQQAQDGKTLSDICTENGADPQAVIEDVKAQVTERVNQAVENGRLTQEQADELLATIDEELNEAMTTPLPEHPIRERMQMRAGDTLVGVVAELAGVEPLDIVQEWRDAESLAAVIEAHGLDVNAVLDETEARITEEVNQALADGNLSQNTADRVLEGLRDRLTERVNSDFPPMGQGMGFGWGMGMRGGFGPGMHDGWGMGMRGGWGMQGQRGPRW